MGRPDILLKFLLCIGLLVGLAFMSWAITREEVIEVAKAFGDCLAPYEEYELFGPTTTNAFLFARIPWEGTTYDLWIVPGHWTVYKRKVAGKDVLAEVSFLPPREKEWSDATFRVLITGETEFQPLLSLSQGFDTVSDGDEVIRIGLYWKPKGFLGLEGPYHRLDFCKVWTSWLWEVPLLDCPQRAPARFEGALVLRYRDQNGNGEAELEEFKIIGSYWEAYNELLGKIRPAIAEISPECWEGVIFHKAQLPKEVVEPLVEKAFGAGLGPVEYEW